MLEYEVRCVGCKTREWKPPPAKGADPLDVPMCGRCYMPMASTGKVRGKVAPDAR